MFVEAVEAYSRMQVAWVVPDGCTPPLVIIACVALPSLLMGPRVHGQIFSLGFLVCYLFDGLFDRTIVFLDLYHLWSRTEWSAFGSFDGLWSNEENEYGTARIALAIWSFWNKEKLFMVSWLSWALNLNLICLFHLQPCKQNLGK